MRMYVLRSAWLSDAIMARDEGGTVAHDRAPENPADTGVPPPPAVAATSRTNRNLWIAFVEEAKANRQYVAYAMKALEEGHPEVAEVFLEVAGAETVHALVHLRALGEVNSSYENLRTVIEEETREASLMYPRMIRQAELEGRLDAADVFRLAFEGETRHARRFQEAFNRLKAQDRLLVPARVTPLPTEPERSVAAGPREPGAEEVGTEKERVAGLRRIRELVFGAQDGLISSVAIAATVMAATQTNEFAIVAGIASAMAGTISMAAGTFLGSRAATQMEEAELEQERRELVRNPDEERAELIAAYRYDGYSLEEAESIVDRLMVDRELALRVMAERELGITPEAPGDPRKDALVMGASYVIGGLIPLLPYLVVDTLIAIPISIALTLCALALVGIVKARTAHRGMLASVLEVTGIGAASGIVGYVLGDLLPRLFGAL
jgi:vacuolar iron transporter family protein